MRGKPIIALLFVALLGIVLTIPLRSTTDDRSASTRKDNATPTPEASKTPSEKPSQSPTPSPEPSETEPPEESPPDRARLTGTYPKSCLEPDGAPDGSGLFAIDQGNGIEISDTSGSGSTTVEGRFPFKWSPSGSYLMTGTGEVYDSTGDGVTNLFEGGGSFSWSWSPIADCVVFASQDKVSVFAPGNGEPKDLHDGLVSRFSFSPSGGDLAFVQDDPEAGEAHLWVASLATGKARRLTSLPLSEDDEIVLAGWTPDATHVLFWRGGSDELLQKGTSLKAVSATGKVKPVARVLAHRDFLASCGDDLYAVVGGGARVEPNAKRLARVSVDGDVEYLTPESAHDESPSCSPEGNLIAVARSASADGRGPGALTVIDRSGSVQFSSQEAGSEDAYPLWGRGDAGVLFIRQPVSGDGDPEVWSISQTRPASPTGATLRSIRRQPGIFRDSWGHWLDWSADEPSGVSVLSGAGS